MNYFGHAAIASYRGAGPGFVLGAMLPDLMNMVGLKGGAPTAPEVLRGLAFHHQTDAVFHQCGSFVSLNRATTAALKSLGLRSGPARAGAHIGIEMLIDGTLIESSAFFTAYSDALEAGASSPHLLSGLGDVSRLVGLLTHLAVEGAPIHAITQERLRFRLERTLQGRRLLEPSPDELAVLAEELAGRAPTVGRAVPQLLQELSSLTTKAAASPQPLPSSGHSV